MIRKVLAITILFTFNSIDKTRAQANFVKFDYQNCHSSSVPIASIKVIDQRPDSNAWLGRVRIGLLKKETNIKTQEPLAEAIRKYYLQIPKDGSTSTQNILLIVHTFFAFEDKNGQAHFKYAADYFTEVQNNQYKLLGCIDTTITYAGFHASRNLMLMIDESLCYFYGHLIMADQNHKEIYSYTDALSYNEIQKKTIKAYNTKNIENGVFENWDNFKNLITNQRERVVRKSNVYRVQYINDRDKIKYKTPSHSKVLAINAKYYFNIEGAFYEMYSKENDFFVSGYSSQFKSAYYNNLVLFGVLGYAISSGNTDFEKLEFKINYKNGELIPIKKLNK